MVGFDYSRSFVDAAKSMRDLPVEPPLEACPTYRVPTEGALVSTSRAAHSPGVDAAAKARTHFLEVDRTQNPSNAKAAGCFQSLAPVRGAPPVYEARQLS